MMSVVLCGQLCGYVYPRAIYMDLLVIQAQLHCWLDLGHTAAAISDLPDNRFSLVFTYKDLRIKLCMFGIKKYLYISHKLGKI